MPSSIPRNPTRAATVTIASGTITVLLIEETIAATKLSLICLGSMFAPRLISASARVESLIYSRLPPRMTGSLNPVKRKRIPITSAIISGFFTMFKIMVFRRSIVDNFLFQHYVINKYQNNLHLFFLIDLQK